MKVETVKKISDWIKFIIGMVVLVVVLTLDTLIVVVENILCDLQYYIGAFSSFIVDLEIRIQNLPAPWNGKKLRVY